MQDRHAYVKNDTKGVWEKVDRVTNLIVATFPLRPAAGGGTPLNPTTALAVRVEDTTDFKRASGAEGTGTKVKMKAKSGYHTHKAEKVIWTYGGRAFYAAGMGGLHNLDLSQFAAIIDLADNFPLRMTRRVPFVESNIPGIQEALDKVPMSTVPLIKIDWSDGCGVPVGGAFWTKLWELLPVGAADAPAKVLVCCFGAHGRTGTALAALMLASGDPAIFSPAVAILTIRTRHCEEAVETGKQLDYLDTLAGDYDLSVDAWDTFSSENSQKLLDQILADAAEEGKGEAAVAAGKKGGKKSSTAGGR